jgi:hypothetical protein
VNAGKLPSWRAPGGDMERADTAPSLNAVLPDRLRQWIVRCFRFTVADPN